MWVGILPKKPDFFNSVSFMGYNRRKFLHSLLQGGGMFVASTLMPHSLKAQAGSATSEEVETASEDELRKLYARAKELFYHKQYGSATIAYQRLVALQPNAIEAYDGLARVYNAQNQQAQVAVLFREALKKNEQSMPFYDRYARSLISLCAGNYGQYRQYVELYGEAPNLPETAAQLYKKAIAITPDKQYLQLALVDIRSKLDNQRKAFEKSNKPSWHLSAETLAYIAEVERSVGQKWVQTRKPLRTLAENPKEVIQKMDSKKRRTLYDEKEQLQRDEHIRLQKTHVYYPLLAQAFKERKMQEAEQYAQGILEVDTSSTAALAKLRTLYKNQKRYGKLKELYEQRVVNHDSYWTKLGLASAMLYEAELTENAAGAATAKSIVEPLLEQIQEDIELKLLYAAASWVTVSSLIHQKKYGQSRKVVLQVIEQLPSDSGLGGSLRIAYVNSYLKENKPQQAIQLLKAMTDSSEADQLQNEPLQPNLKSMWKNRQRGNSNANASSIAKGKGKKQASAVPRKTEVVAYYKLAQLQHRQGQRKELGETLQKIEAITPNNKFVSKYRKG
ncbi:MAG: hypothetical protein LBK47_10195 [Prevotellaceae bacterium]|jgi:predicted Zn-dependent protease|nr:hypothetical protein [Prevotellaceae bacterium]